MRSTLVSTVLFFSGALSQTFSPVTDSNGIKFWQANLDSDTTAGGLQLGLALPAEDDNENQNDYIGHVVGALNNGKGWTGISHAGPMTESLLLIMWPNGKEVMTSFRFASAYTAPDLYTGNASLSQISSSVNDTHFELTYKCSNCWTWNQSGDSGSQVPATTASAAQLLGWVQATSAPTTPDDADTGISQHNSDGLFGAVVASARNSAYSSWAALATSAPTATSTGTNNTATATVSATSTSLTVSCPADHATPNTTYDYIVVGGGAGGIPIAAKLTEAGKSVLLIERGPPSSGRWGGNMRPDWLKGTNLTRFDVPGLCNEIWEDSDGITCPDVGTMSGCVLGGGTAVNAALWWKANPADFDEVFPAGWKHADMQPSIDRVFDKIPWTDRPSADGKLYLDQGYNSVSHALQMAGYRHVTANDAPGDKNHTFSAAPFMYSHGERSGPMATYLVDADVSSNFKLWTNTTVSRVLRNGSHITGVEVEAYGDGGYCGKVSVTPVTGRVILSAGAFGTSKILLRSGIGPADQLAIVKSSADGPDMIDESQWLNLPVGENLHDHTSTDVVIHNTQSVFYDYYAAYDTPITSDKNAYLNDRSGPLAQSAPNINPMFWDEITGTDGSVRQLQWQTRTEGAHGIGNNGSMTISQYLGRGKTSVGRMTITAGLNMVVSELPYMNTAEDRLAIISGLKMLRSAFSNSSVLTLVYPPSNKTIEDFVDSYTMTVSARSGNHWMGSAKMGLDSGLVNNGTSVVDLDTKVYGTDNLFVVDASIFPGMITTNPSALIVAVAERASERILALSNDSLTGRTVVSPIDAPKISNATTPLSGPVPAGPPATAVAPPAPKAGKPQPGFGRFPPKPHRHESFVAGSRKLYDF